MRNSGTIGSFRKNYACIGNHTDTGVNICFYLLRRTKLRSIASSSGLIGERMKE